MCSSGQYESSRDIKCYLVSVLGNINHTLFGSFSLMPSQPGGQLRTVAWETRARLLAANESEAGGTMLVHLVTATTAARSVSGPGQGGRGGWHAVEPLRSPFLFHPRTRG